MKITIQVVEFTSATENVLGERVFNTVDCATFLVANWMDSDTDSMKIPDGMFLLGFRYFTNENSITVYVGQGKVVPNDQ